MRELIASENGCTIAREGAVWIVTYPRATPLGYQARALKSYNDAVIFYDRRVTIQRRAL